MHPPARVWSCDYVHWLMDRDRKSPGLKALQGLIWQDGYESGELRGQVYPDVPPAFERWRARGIDVYIYSSGSVLAQQLLFGSTEAGDLTTFLNGYFDTAVGPKTSPDSYGVIAARMHVPPPEMLFVSDVAAGARRGADGRHADRALRPRRPDAPPGIGIAPDRSKLRRDCRLTMSRRRKLIFGVVAGRHCGGRFPLVAELPASELREAAEAASQEFRMRLARGAYGEIVRSATPEFRSSTTESDFAKAMEDVKARLGGWQSSEEPTWRVLAGTRGQTVTLVYDSRFERGTGDRRIRLARRAGPAAPCWLPREIVCSGCTVNHARNVRRTL